MIRYPEATQAQILAQIAALKPDWMQKAAEETAKVVTAGYFTPPKPTVKGGKKGKAPPSIWSDVKIVYMRLQQFKCIFCERAMAEEEGSIEHDVEHYRPKNALKAWRAPKPLATVPHLAGGAADTGYYWLAFDTGNYAAACKPCNSTQKSSYFPIAGARGKAVDSIAQLDHEEQPLVIFPMVEDPASLITFNGILAVPVHSSGPKHVRAAVTIALFKLNTREELRSDRFRAIRSVFSAYELLQTTTSDVKKQDAALQLIELTSVNSPQSGCAKAYLDVLKSDPNRGWEVYLEARAYLTKGE